jgi:hypothetical protein
MTIFIVWFRNFSDDDEFVSAHSTEEKALAKISKYGHEQRSMRVEPYVIDSED